MLDEIDKLGADFRAILRQRCLKCSIRSRIRRSGITISMLLSICPGSFHNHGDVLDTVPSALRDRMEILELPGYTEEEKVQIAKNYLVPRGREASGLQPDQIEFEDLALHTSCAITPGRPAFVISNGKSPVSAESMRGELEGKDPHLTVTTEVVAELLGSPRYQLEEEVEERVKRPGVVIGLAWTRSAAISCSSKQTSRKAAAPDGHRPGRRRDAGIDQSRLDLGAILRRRARTGLRFL
jgi:ATP-dependent Lon protease